jgi:hypothetical protein
LLPPKLTKKLVTNYALKPVVIQWTNIDYFCLIMITEHEKLFYKHWQTARFKEGSWKRQLATGLPYGVIFGMSIPMMVMSGILPIPRAKTSFFVLLCIGVFCIILFVGFFIKRFRWERNEEHFLYLTKKMEKEAAAKIATPSA